MVAINEQMLRKVPIVTSSGDLEDRAKRLFYALNKSPFTGSESTDFIMRAGRAPQQKWRSPPLSKITISSDFQFNEKAVTIATRACTWDEIKSNPDLQQKLVWPLFHESELRSNSFELYHEIASNQTMRGRPLIEIIMKMFGDIIDSLKSLDTETNSVSDVSVSVSVPVPHNSKEKASSSVPIIPPIGRTMIKLTASAPSEVRTVIKEVLADHLDASSIVPPAGRIMIKLNVSATAAEKSSDDEPPLDADPTTLEEAILRISLLEAEMREMRKAMRSLLKALLDKHNNIKEL